MPGGFCGCGGVLDLLGPVGGFGADMFVVGGGLRVGSWVLGYRLCRVRKWDRDVGDRWELEQLKCGVRATLSERELLCVGTTLC